MHAGPAAMAALAAAALLAAGCAGQALPPVVAEGSAATRPAPAVAPATTAPTTTIGDPAPETTATPLTSPEWLGQRPLPVDERGFGEVQPTPPELVDRRLPTPPLLPPPPDRGYHAAIGPVPAEVLARSTWNPVCPVPAEELRYVTVSFWGFDGRHHTGELLAHAEVAEDLVEVFRRLHAQRFPIEEMRITRAEELTLPPTGDGNNTTAFVCRPAVGSSRWSQHAYGLAVDINPFHNPYVRGELVLPELASAYLDRDHVRPGMIFAGDVVTSAFAELGWEWGGTWRSALDLHHFSRHGG